MGRDPETFTDKDVEVGGREHSTKCSVCYGYWLLCVFNRRPSATCCQHG